MATRIGSSFWLTDMCFTNQGIIPFETQKRPLAIAPKAMCNLRCSNNTASHRKLMLRLLIIGDFIMLWSHGNTTLTQLHVVYFKVWHH